MLLDFCVRPFFDQPYGWGIPLLVSIASAHQRTSTLPRYRSLDTGKVFRIEAVSVSGKSVAALLSCDETQQSREMSIVCGARQNDIDVWRREDI